MVLNGVKLFTVTATLSSSSMMSGGPGNWPLTKNCSRVTPSGARDSQVKLSSNCFVCNSWPGVKGLCSSSPMARLAPTLARDNNTASFMAAGSLRSNVVDVNTTGAIICVMEFAAQYVRIKRHQGYVHDRFIARH